MKIGDKWGYIARSGRLVIPPKFDAAASFFNGRGAIVVKGRYGYIDSTGKTIVPPTYAYAHFFLGELAGVTFHPERSDGAGTGYLNRQGRVLWNPKPSAQ